MILFMPMALARMPEPVAGNAQDLEQSLDRAVLSKLAVETVEGDLDSRFPELFSHISADINGNGIISFALQRFQNRVPARERNLPLRRQPAHEHTDLFFRYKSHVQSILYRRGR